MTESFQAKYIQNSFSVFFPRQAAIRRKANEFEDILKHHYVQPNILPIPDELEPSMPRIVFDSHKGYSQLILSQNNLALNVTYSPDWQQDSGKGKEYIEARLPLLFSLLDVLGGVQPYFCGLASKVHLTMHGDERSVVMRLANLYLNEREVKDLYDLQLKKTRVVQDRFFSNVAISNFRGWKVADTTGLVIPLARNKAEHFGIEIVGDFNDRYAYNEQADYTLSEYIAKEVISEGFKHIQQTIIELQNEHN